MAEELASGAREGNQGQPNVDLVVIRHPCAVLLSRMRLEWETHLDGFLGQPRLDEDYLDPYLDVIQGAESAVEKHAVMWCVENLVPLREMAHYPWVFCMYKQLTMNPESESRRILEARLDVLEKAGAHAG